MKKTVLFGDMNKWNKALDLVSKYDVVVVGLCDPDNQGMAAESDSIFTIDDLIDNYKSKAIEAVINVDASIPVWNEWFYKRGIRENYAISTRLYGMEDIDDEAAKILLQPYVMIKPELHNLEFHLADHCNLKCKGCTHFSNLIKEPAFPDFDLAKKDFARLSELFFNIQEIHLLGGEPFLNADIGRYCSMVREAFPYSKIVIVTNGLLIPKTKPEIFDVIRENDIMLSISDYTCLDEDKILSVLGKNGINVCELRNGKQIFMKSLNPKGDLDPEDVFNACPRRACTCLRNGMLAACVQPFMIHVFNERYGTSLSDEGAISIYDDGVNGYRIIEHLSKPMGACRFCGFEEPFEWGISKEPVPMSDWCIGE